jgi:SAM-dependent methyltransferase
VPPVPDAEFDGYSQSYDQTVNSALAFTGLKVDFFTKVKTDYLKDLIRSRFTDLSRVSVLDVGCGVGNSLSLLAQGAAGRLAGVDVSEACLATARERKAGVEYRAYDGLHLPHPHAAFDVVFSICVFHHIAIADRIPLAQDIRRVLRPGGMFAIFEHNPLNPFTMRVVNSCEFDENAILLRSGEAETLMQNAGFREVYSRFILTIPASGSTLRYVDRMFGRLPLGAQYYTVGVV